MTMWLLQQATKNTMEQAEASGWTPSAEQQTELMAYRDNNPVLSLAGNQAAIKIKGVMTKTPNFMARYFGGGNTVYSDIVDAITTAEADPKIKDITLNIDSPGGQLDGLFSVIAAMQGAKKPIYAIVDGSACSSAYAIAAQADTITAVDKSCMVGSVGIVGTVTVSESRVEVTSTNAPKKRPDVTTEEGKAVLREELDALHDLFVDAIATGRSVTVAKINKDYGQGAALLAEQAQTLGMIDAIGVNKASNTNPTASRGANKTESTMDLETLKSQHPETYAAALQLGANAENDRVTAHVTMGKASGDLDTALTAISEGTELTASMQATYLAAQMNRTNAQDRANDNPAAVTPNVEEPDAADATADALCDLMGVTI